MFPWTKAKTKAEAGTKTKVAAVTPETIDKTYRTSIDIEFPKTQTVETEQTNVTDVSTLSR
jgi:hypothetical protein